MRFEDAGLRAARGLFAADVFFAVVDLDDPDVFFDPPERAVEVFFDEAEAPPDARRDPPVEVRLDDPALDALLAPPDVVRLALDDDVPVVERPPDEVFFEVDFAAPDVFRLDDDFAAVAFFAVERPPAEVLLPDDLEPDDLAPPEAFLAVGFFADELFEDELFEDADRDDVDFFAPEDFADELFEPVDFFVADLDLDAAPFEAVLLDDELFEAVFFLVAMFPPVFRKFYETSLAKKKLHGAKNRARKSGE